MRADASWATEIGAGFSVAETIARIADPRDGFFDIKPAPDFFPPDYSLLWLLLALFLLSIVLFFALLWRRRRDVVPGSYSTLTPRQQFSIDLERIKRARASESITVREFSSDLSLATRRFVEQRFGFPATDRTTAETLEQLGPRLAERCAQLPAERSKQQLKEFKALLKSLERTTYAGRDAERLSIGSEELAALLTKSELLVDEFEKLLVVPSDGDSKSGKSAA